MKLIPISLAVLCLASLSCDKLKNIVSKTKSTLSSELAKKTGTSLESLPDPALQQLVDQTPEGAIFRKDLPFPKQVEVKITRRMEISGRFTEKSELGSQANILKGTVTNVTKLARAGDKVSYALLESIFTEPVIQGADDSKEPVVKQLAPPSAPFGFVKSGSTWKSSVATDFRVASRAQLISPHFETLLIENTLAPRALWFGKNRYKIGAELAISSEFLPMLVSGNAKGHLKLVLESFEAVGGHPCGVFGITGDFSRKKFPDFDGVLTDEEVTIESGKVWLSLLYPIILREDLQIIQTSSTGGQGGLSTTGRSSGQLSVLREWKGGGK